MSELYLRWCTAWKPRKNVTCTGSGEEGDELD